MKKKELLIYTLNNSVRHMDLLPNKTKFGFTLAEVLITLGIIGIVAAMTIPGLINNYKAARLKSQFLKSYSTIQQVFKRMQDDEISVDPISYKDETRFYKVFANYLSGAMLCYGRAQGCYSGTRDGIVYKGAITNHLDDGQILLNDGTLIMFENMVNGPYVYLTVDLNGIKNPPNIMGYDTFAFQLINGELLAMGDRGTGWTGEQYCDINKILRLTKNNSTATGAPYGHSCAHYAKVESDYFKKVVKKYKY